MIAERKNIIPLVLLFVFMLTALMGGITPPSFASGGEPSVKVESGFASPGARVEVDVVIENNPGILGATFAISYSPKLELINGRPGDAFSALTMTKPGKYTSPCKFVWDGQELSPDDVKDGTILTLTFRVSETAASGDVLPIGIVSAGDVFDTRLDPIPLTVTGGSVTVGEESAVDQLSISSGTFSQSRIGVSVSCQKDAVRGLLVLAGYAPNGQQMECQVQQTTLSIGDNSFQFNRKTDAGFYRAFLLDLTMRPLCPFKTISETPVFTVTFFDYDGTVLSRQEIPSGESAAPPTVPDRPGFAFTGWNGDYTNVTADRALTAQYTEDTAPAVVVGTVNAKPGDTDVEVTVAIRNNPGILGMTLSLADFTVSASVSSIGIDAFLNVPKVSINALGEDAALTMVGYDYDSNSTPTAQQIEQAQEATKCLINAVVASGAKQIVLDISGITNGTVLTLDVPEIESFELRGGGKIYSDLTLTSHAHSTAVCALTISDSTRIPLDIYSDRLTLEAASITSIGYTLLLHADGTNISLLRDNTLASTQKGAIICKNMTLSSVYGDYADGVLNVSGNIYCWGAIIGTKWMDISNGSLVPIDADTFDDLINPNWVLASSVPSGAQIIDEKWTYDYTSYTASYSSDLYGWTFDYSSWGNWSEWLDYSLGSSDNREVESQRVIEKDAHREYRYGRYYYYDTPDGRRFYSPSCCLPGSYRIEWTEWKETKYYNYGDNVTCGCEHPEDTVTHPHAASYYHSNMGWWPLLRPYEVINDRISYYWEETRWVDTSYKMQYRYRDKIFYFHKVENKSSISEPSGPDISNIQHWVQYREI